MRLFLAMIWIGIYPASGFAQSRIDSLYVFEQDRVLAGRAILSPIFDAGERTDSYGELQLDQQYDRGGLRMAQQAFDKKMIGFTARGFNRIGRFKIGAVFQFNNQVEDSLANNLRNDLDPLATYYGYASKSGHYRRQNYIAHTSIDYRLNDYLSPYLNVDYHKHWTAGTVDPRVKSDRFILKFKPGLAVHVKEHALAAFVNLGKADETVSVKYVNDDFGSSLLYPERMYHSNYGYGYSRTKDSAANYKYDTYKGFGIAYQTEVRKTMMQASYEYQQYYNTNQFYPKTSTSYRGPRAVFHLNSTTAELNIIRRRSDRARHMLDATYQHHSGYDGSLPSSNSLDIVNYKVNESTLDIAYSFLLDKTESFAKEFGATYRHYYIHQVDLAQYVDVEATAQHIGAFVYLYLHSGARTFKFGLTPYMVLPQDVEFQYSPLSMTDFVKNVANTDYHYYRLKKTGAVFSGEYLTGQFGRNRFGVYGTVDYGISDKPIVDKVLAPAFDPSGHRINAHLGVRMYIYPH